MEAYFNFKLFLELAPIVIFILLAILIFFASLIKQCEWDRKIKYLQSLGFERYLEDVASVGGKAWYGWKCEKGMRISEEELERIDYKKLKERFPK
jgi:hypothetical protein